MNWGWKLLALLLSVTLIAWIFYRPARRPEITIATVNNADMILMQQLSSEFEKQTGIKVRWVVLGENVLRQRLTIDIATGSNTFDVITIGSYEAPLWGERGWVVPLDDLGASYDYDDIFSVVREGLSYHGKMYALPFYSESSFTYYRKDLFEKAGLEMPNQPSYGQIRSYAQKLHDPSHSVYGICLRGEPGWGGNVAYLSTLVDTFGGRWFDLNWTPELTSPAWAEATTFYVNLLRNFGPPGATTDGYNENRALFANGIAQYGSTQLPPPGTFWIPLRAGCPRPLGLRRPRSPRFPMVPPGFGVGDWRSPPPQNTLTVPSGLSRGLPAGTILARLASALDGCAFLPVREHRHTRFRPTCKRHRLLPSFAKLF